MAEEALFVGGPADGQWLAVESAEPEYVADVAPHPQDMMSGRALPIRRALYRRRANYAVDEPAWIYDFVEIR